MELQSRQSELQETNEQLGTKARLLAEQNEEVERKNSEVEQARHALEDKAAELALTSKYKSEFLANMSHELRTPLNSTLILAKLLADNKPGNLSGEQVKYAQTIHDAGNDLLALINDILDLAKIEAGQATVVAEPVDIARTVQSLVEPLRPLAQEKGLVLAATLAPDVPATLHTDPLRLGQVLKNLLSLSLIHI